MAPQKKRILFVYLHPSSFVIDDLNDLGKKYDIEAYHFGAKRNIKGFALFVEWVRQILWLIRRIHSSDLVIGWFIDYHMFFPIFMSRWLGKPTLICEGGFGCLNIPEFKHGVFFSWWRKHIARYVVKSVSFLVPVTEKLVDSENTYTLWPQKKRFGLKEEIRGFATPYQVIPTGYKPDEWPMGKAERQRRVCTVGFINSIRTFKIKGIDIAVEVSRLMPDTDFVIVGVEKEFQKVIESEYQPPSNFTMHEPIKRSELVEVYRSSSVYIQLSRVEGMPNVMCESMLCGCIPVGSPVFGIPDIVGDAGYIVDSPDPQHIADVIDRALSETQESRMKARDRIKNNFSSNKRGEMLGEVIENLTQSGKR